MKNIYKTEIQEVEKADILEQFNRAQKASNSQELLNKINEKVEDANKGRKSSSVTLQEGIDSFSEKIIEQEKQDG